MSLIGNVKALCKQRKTSIPNLERELGFAHGAIYKWDVNSPSVDKIQRVASYFDTSIDFLVHGIDKFQLNRESFNKNSVLKVVKESGMSVGQVVTVLDEVKSAIFDETTV